MQDRGEPGNVTESPEFRAYLDQLWNRLPNYARRAAAIEPEEPYSVEWLAKAGRFWWDVREELGLSRHDAAEKVGIPINEVRFFELGLAEPIQVEDRAFSYASVFNRPELYGQFCDSFGIQKRPESQP